jgi:hypothetical protein
MRLYPTIKKVRNILLKVIVFEVAVLSIILITCVSSHIQIDPRVVEYLKTCGTPGYPVCSLRGGILL